MIQKSYEEKLIFLKKNNFFEEKIFFEEKETGERSVPAAT